MKDMLWKVEFQAPSKEGHAIYIGFQASGGSLFGVKILQ